MKKPAKVEVEKERQVHTYAELWQTSRILLQKGIDEPEGSFHQFMASLVLTAFCFEAFLNHIGKKLFKSWEGLEKLAPKEKLNVIAEFLKIPIEYGGRPWQIMTTLFGFRNSIAHGKSVTVKESELLDMDVNFDKIFRALALTDWEQYCTEANAQRAREDVKAMIETLQRACNFKDDFPFVPGIQVRGASGA
jgi:hypothetical protein